jgi:hypothetical protein
MDGGRRVVEGGEGVGGVIDLNEARPALRISTPMLKDQDQSKFRITKSRDLRHAAATTAFCTDLDDISTTTFYDD